jgi:hypothetical protein
MLYSTGEVIKLFEAYKELMFMAFIGTYEGETIRYNPNFQMIVWYKNDIDEAIELNEDFLKTKWKMIAPARIPIAKYPYIKLFEECFALN